MSSLLAQLLEYRRLGWAVVPACPPDHRGVKPVHAQGCNTPAETPLSHYFATSTTSQSWALAFSALAR
jgi:hypothetical protein